MERQLGQKRFIVGLCYDVLLEVLRTGKRRQLATLEKVGRRFHRSSDGKFVVKPLLLLDIEFRLVALQYTSGEHNFNNTFKITLITLIFAPGN